MLPLLSNTSTRRPCLYELISNQNEYKTKITQEWLTGYLDNSTKSVKKKINYYIYTVRKPMDTPIGVFEAKNNMKNL